MEYDSDVNLIDLKLSCNPARVSNEKTETGNSFLHNTHCFLFLLFMHAADVSWNQTEVTLFCADICLLCESIRFQDFVSLYTVLG